MLPSANIQFLMMVREKKKNFLNNCTSGTCNVNGLFLGFVTICRHFRMPHFPRHFRSIRVWYSHECILKIEIKKSEPKKKTEIGSEQDDFVSLNQWLKKYKKPKWKKSQIELVWIQCELHRFHRTEHTNCVLFVANVTICQMEMDFIGVYWSEKCLSGGKRKIFNRVPPSAQG